MSTLLALSGSLMLVWLDPLTLVPGFFFFVFLYTLAPEAHKVGIDFLFLFAKMFLHWKQPKANCILK